MPYVLIDENNVVIQKQPYHADGFIKVSDDVVCGQILQKDGSFKNPELTEEQIKAIRHAEIIQALEEIDRKSIRALREGNAERIAAMEAEAEALRKDLK